VPSTVQQNKVAPAINKGAVDLKPAATGVLKPVRTNQTTRVPLSNAIANTPAYTPANTTANTITNTTANTTANLSVATSARRNVKSLPNKDKDMEQLMQQIHQLKRECNTKEEKIGTLEKKNVENEERCTYLFRKCRNYEKKLEEMGLDPVTLEQLSYEKDQRVEKENQMLIQTWDSLSSKYSNLITQARDQLLSMTMEMNIPTEQYQHCLEPNKTTNS